VDITKYRDDELLIARTLRESTTEAGESFRIRLAIVASKRARLLMSLEYGDTIIWSTLGS
jgi:hypothetical protein